MSKIYWTDATGKKWDIKDMSESHINNILNKLSMQDIMKCVAFVQMASIKKKKDREIEIELHGEIAQDLYNQGVDAEIIARMDFDPDNPWEERE